MYSQTNPAWSPLTLGTSSWTMGNSGCVVTSIANALSLAGYPYTPKDVVLALDANACFTDTTYIVNGKPSPGLLYWSRVTKAYPQFSISSTGEYEFTEVKWGTNTHWVLVLNGTIYDPWDGTTHQTMPSAYKPTGYVVRASIESFVGVDQPIASTAIPAQTTAFEVPVTFEVTLLYPAHFRLEPSITSPIMTTYPKGTQIVCDATVVGQLVDVYGVTSDRWYKSQTHGWYISATVANHN